MVPLAVAKIANVAVAPALICTATLGPIGEMHTPITGSVWQIESASGRAMGPVFFGEPAAPPAQSVEVCDLSTRR
jgi:hypothetical protein